MDIQHHIEAVSVIVPVYNERGSVLETLEKLRSTLKQTGIRYEIIVVNDASKDGTSHILDGIREPGITILHHPQNRGYGASLKTGIAAAKHPWILITDADGTYPIDRIPDLIAHTATHDMVVGSREGAHVHRAFMRSIGRGIVRRFASYVAGAAINDLNSGLRIFKKEDALRFWNLFPDGFSFTSTITVASHTRGNRVHYLPIDYHKRTGTSSIKPARDFIGFLSLIARLAIYYRPLKVFVPLAIGLFFAAWGVLAYGYFGLHEILDATWAVIFITSIQTLMFGFLADMIVKRFYTE